MVAIRPKRYSSTAVFQDSEVVGAVVDRRNTDSHVTHGIRCDPFGLMIVRPGFIVDVGPERRAVYTVLDRENAPQARVNRAFANDERIAIDVHYDIPSALAFPWFIVAVRPTAGPVRSESDGSALSA